MISPLFVCHGGPTLVIDNNEYTHFLKELAKSIKPKTIVIFTAHWETEITTISYSDDTYNMIYDFYGFPKELYDIKYPAKGSKVIASELQLMLKNHHIKSELDTTRGLDHGSWVMLQIMFPEAKIPVIQVSVNPNLDVNEQYKIGAALRSLGKEDILVIGSGATVHNLASIQWESTEPKAWAVEFDNWLIDKVEKNDIEALFKYRQLAPYAKQAVPTEEHLIPLFIAMGSSQGNSIPRLLYRSYEYGTLSYICFKF